MLDGWSIIDSVHRLEDLAQHFPQIRHRKRIPAFQSLLRIAEGVNTLRNTVQHLPGTIHGLTEAPQWSVWGVLTWCAPGSDNIIHCGQYLCGKLTFAPSFRLLVRLERQFDCP